MPLTTKLVADYVELINAQLDSFPVQKIEDFKQIAEALKSITESNQPHTIPPSLQDRVKAIKDIIDYPEDYVEDLANYDEFKGIILGRVTKVVENFLTLSIEEKNRYIVELQERRSADRTNRAILQQHQAPAINSEAHVESDEEALVRLQREFQAEAFRPAIRSNLGMPSLSPQPDRQFIRPMDLPTSNAIAEAIRGSPRSLNIFGGISPSFDLSPTPAVSINLDPIFIPILRLTRLMGSVSFSAVDRTDIRNHADINRSIKIATDLSKLIAISSVLDNIERTLPEALNAPLLLIYQIHIAIGITRSITRTLQSAMQMDLDATYARIRARNARITRLNEATPMATAILPNSSSSGTSSPNYWDPD